MQLLLIILTMLFFGCAVKQAEPEVKQAAPGVIQAEIDLPVEKEIHINYTVHDMCTTYYFFAKDTSKPVLAMVVGKDEKGKYKEVIYRSFKSYVPATSLSLYDSSGKEIMNYYRIDEEGRESHTTKTFYFYNLQGQMIRTVAFDYKRRIRDDVDKGILSPDGCIITDDDYEKKKSWKQATVWNYRYDEEGRLIEEFAPVINSSQNRYVYTYDENGRKTEGRSLARERLFWIEKYAYDKQGYQFTRTWFEDDGSRQKEHDGTLLPVDTFRFKTDRFGNVVEEKVIEEGGKQVSRDNKSYDSKNRLIRHEIFDDKDKLLGFYTYHYSALKKPVEREFIVTEK